MILDTSVLVAILRKEPEASTLLAVMGSAATRRISAGNRVELAAVTSNNGDDELRSILTELSATLRIAIEPVSVEQARIGRAAYLEFRKGRHQARLNFGDCFAYALAKATGEPLLFKGEDFIHTDVKRAI